MKTENKLFHKVRMYLLLFLFIISISINLTLYGVQSAHDVQESVSLSANLECNNSGDGSNDTLIHKVIYRINNSLNANAISNLLFHVVGPYSIIILFILICEFYYYAQGYLYAISKRSLIAQKVRLNN